MWPKSFSNSFFFVVPEEFFFFFKLLKVSGVQHYNLTSVQAFLRCWALPVFFFFFNYKLDVCGIPTESKSLVIFF